MRTATQRHRGIDRRTAVDQHCQTPCRCDPLRRCTAHRNPRYHSPLSGLQQLEFPLERPCFNGVGLQHEPNHNRLHSAATRHHIAPLLGTGTKGGTPQPWQRGVHRGELRKEQTGRGRYCKPDHGRGRLSALCLGSGAQQDLPGHLHRRQRVRDNISRNNLLPIKAAGTEKEVSEFGNIDMLQLTDSALEPVDLHPQSDCEF